MGGASSYLAILSICGFLSAAWLATKLSQLAGVSSIVLEITTGVILGPSVVGLISKEYAECEFESYTDCTLPADFETLLASGESLGDEVLDHMAHGDACSHWSSHDTHDTHATTDSHGDTTGSHSTGDASELSETHIEGETGSESSHAETTTTGHATATTAHAAVAATTTTAAAAATTTTRAAAAGGATTNFLGWEHDASATPGTRRMSSSGGGAEYSSYAECLQKTCLSEVSHECGLYPDVFTLIGHTGVALMIFESGMHFDFDKAKVVGPKACLVAVIGTILPLVSGTLVMLLYGYPMSPDGVSVGTALAPTSVGIALRLLGEAGVLQMDFGQAIITAAFVDDILSLVLFNVLFSLRGDFNVMTTVINPIIGIAFMIIAMGLAVKFWPKAINEWIIPRLPSRTGDPKVSVEDEALFVLMMLVMVTYATLTHFLGTHLWGCFIAGMSFACLDKPGQHGHTHHVWVRQTKRFTSWMIRIFFACTVAFSIPIGKLLSIEAFLKGSVMGIGPCILTKVMCAPFMGKAKFVIGWAMVGRAEFAYLIAQMAAASNMIDEKAFSICIWALLYATIFAPFIFRAVLSRYIISEGLEVGPSVDVDALSDEEDDFDENKREVGTKQADPEATTFGKGFSDLEKIHLEDATPEGAEEGQPQNRRFGFGWGQGRSVSQSRNGFLCCLFQRMN